MPDTRAAIGALLARVPLLASFGTDQLRELADACTGDVVPAGTYIFRQGELGDALYIVESGMIEAVLDDGLTTETVVRTFVPGDFFGEMALLTGQPRSATMRALTDSRVLLLARSHFDRMIAEDPLLAMRLSRTLSLRLSDANEQLSGRGSRLCTVVSHGEIELAGLLIVRLMRSISMQSGRQSLLVLIGIDPPAALGSVRPAGNLTITTEPIPSYPDAGLCMVLGPETTCEQSDSSIAAFLDDARQRFHQVIVWTSNEYAVIHAAALHRSVNVTVLGCGRESVGGTLRSAEGLTSALGMQARIAINDEPGNRNVTLPASHFQPIWIDVDEASDNAPLGDPISQQGQRGIHRLARALIGASVGLALSGGAAQGLAHLGVIQALIEANIPIDMIVGTSGGALYGSMVAAGHPIRVAQARVIEDTRRNLLDRIDLGIPRRGLIRGRRIEKMIHEALGDLTFAELPYPFRAVATDLENGDEVVLSHGLVYQAVRASISIPGVFDPYRLNGRLLVDGAVVTPLPVRPVRNMGADFVIAVHVPAPGKVSDERKRRSGHRLDESHNLVSTIVRSYAFAGDVLAESNALQADICIRPDVALFGWRDYRSARTIIEAGREAGCAQVDRIKELLPVTVETQ